jgi:hypothetical protein
MNKQGICVNRKNNREFSCFYRLKTKIFKIKNMSNFRITNLIKSSKNKWIKKSSQSILYKIKATQTKITSIILARNNWSVILKKIIC